MTIDLSRRELDCIISVHALSSDGWSARVKDVASMLEVSPPTALQFLDKLKSLGLVEKGRSGYRLSSRGVDRFNESTRTHRLMETLLVRNGLSLEEACRVSSSLRLPIGEADLEKLCAKMSHPDKCPHGRPIPVGGHHV